MSLPVPSRLQGTDFSELKRQLPDPASGLRVGRISRCVPGRESPSAHGELPPSPRQQRDGGADR